MTSDVFDSPLFSVLVQLASAGFQFRVRPDGQVQVRPISRLPADACRLMREHPDDLRTLITVAMDRGVAERRDVFRQQLGSVSPPAVPEFVFQPGTPYVCGRCFSCSDALPAARFGRCWRCSLAWRLAAGVPVDAVLAEAIDTARLAWCKR
jgi:hypothetical protein